MSIVWDSAEPPRREEISAFGWLRILLRGTALAVLVFGGLAIMLLLRLIERPLCGHARPVTPHITRSVCKTALRIIGLRLEVSGAPMRARGAIVANHASWLDIFALNASKRIYFVSKSEVARWPGIGWLARATGTVFIERNAAKAREQTQVFRARLLAGHKLLFFPEGTSTDGRRVLPFKTTLFQAFLAPELRAAIAVQPVTVIYRAPDGADPRFYGWWGDTSFAAHLRDTLAQRRQGAVKVIYHAPLAVAAYGDRKALAKACEDAVREGWLTGSFGTGG
ncbi:lysophospholipid acyltransferase family protein [Sulfitobacter aestuarii]|uniref:Lysophospholipid acyltransferase family protein n=1 Tax=Sulfitobacter aestuarii TaxID=2161676 RepID=A0ABW5U1P9_9RHOB